VVERRSQGEKKAHEMEAKEWDAAGKKRREHEKEEFEYAFKPEQRLAKESLQDENTKLEKEMSIRKAELENELATREAAVAAKEQELAELQKKASMVPKEIENAVARAVKEVTERLTLEGKNREELMKKEFEEERNVLKIRIESLRVVFPAPWGEEFTGVSSLIPRCLEAVKKLFARQEI
jgi:mRNA-degrading endonuclease RelE of RelBE toxin-antitoxin system